MAATSSHSFSQLMAISRAHTESTQANVAAVEQARAQKKAEEQRRKAERERKEKEEARKRREKMLEEMKREETLRKKKEQIEAEKRERIREAERQNAKVVRGYPIKANSRKGVKDDTGDVPAATELTRDEKRQLRLQRQRASQFSESTNASPRRPVGSYKTGKRLAGGASNIVVNSVPTPPPEGAGGIRERLSKMPMMLTKLNVNKRDTRTIDEILRDREREKQGKMLVGDQAKSFDGWFTPVKKGVKPEPASSSLSATKSKASSTSSPSSSRPFASTAKPTPNHPSKKRPPPSDTHPSHPPPPSKKARRPIEEEEDDDDDDDLEDDLFDDKNDHSNSVSSEIWKLFGKDRSTYMQNDNFSDDDDDMEVDASHVVEEEEKSARLGRKEDELLLREEMMREEEKRKRKARAY